MYTCSLTSDNQAGDAHSAVFRDLIGRITTCGDFDSHVNRLCETSAEASGDGNEEKSSSTRDENALDRATHLLTFVQAQFGRWTSEVEIHERFDAVLKEMASCSVKRTCALLQTQVDMLSQILFVYACMEDVVKRMFACASLHSLRRPLAQLMVILQNMFAIPCRILTYCRYESAASRLFACDHNMFVLDESCEGNVLMVPPSLREVFFRHQVDALSAQHPHFSDDPSFYDTLSCSSSKRPIRYKIEVVDEDREAESLRYRGKGIRPLMISKMLASDKAPSLLEAYHKASNFCTLMDIVLDDSVPAISIQDPDSIPFQLYASSPTFNDVDVKHLGVRSGDLTTTPTIPLEVHVLVNPSNLMSCAIRSARFSPSLSISTQALGHSVEEKTWSPAHVHSVNGTRPIVYAFNKCEM